MNQVKHLYADEPQYVWNAFTGKPITTIQNLPCGLPVHNDIQTDIALLDSLPKSRIWYGHNTEVFIDSPYHNVYNELFLTAIQKKDFSLNILTTSKGIMKYINTLQNIRNVEVGIDFSSDIVQENTLTQRLDLLRRVYFCDINTIVYLNTEADIVDITNFAELISGLCHKVYLYGKNNKVADEIRNVLEEHQKPVYCIE